MTDNRKRRSRPKAKRHDNNRQGPTVELTIDRFSHDGRGISLWQEKTVFVEGAIVGEKVSAKITRQQTRFSEATTVNVLSPAKERVTPVCQHFVTCGGCQLQHMNDSLQIQVKQQAVLDQLLRIAHITPQEISTPITARSDGYRLRARLGVWFDSSGNLTLGFRQKKDHTLVKIEQCQVLLPALNELLTPLHNCLALHNARAITHIEMLATETEMGLVIRHTKPLTTEISAALDTLSVSYNCAIWLQSTSDPLHLENTIGQSVKPLLHYEIANTPLKMGFHPAEFTQVNGLINNKMIALALAWLNPTENEHIVDLFCGIGNFTLPVAQNCKKVTGIEVVASMVERGRENALKNKVSNVEFIAADLTKISDKYLQKLLGQVDALLLDPPRDGARGVCDNIKRISPKRILYVSCNPATLARDSESLVKAGYELTKLGILDMFPHTAHVESMALFVKSI